MRLGLLFMMVKPLSRGDRIEAIAQGVRAMPIEEAYYRFSKCSQPRCFTAPAGLCAYCWPGSEAAGPPGLLFSGFKYWYDKEGSNRLLGFYGSYPFPAADTTMALVQVEDCLKLIPAVGGAPHRYLWSSDDADAEVLYINFKKPSHATDSELTEDDTIVRYEGDEVIGLTILHASQRYLPHVRERRHEPQSSPPPPSSASGGP